MSVKFRQIFRILVFRLAARLGLATRDDLEPLRQAIGRSEQSHSDWHRQISSLTSAVVQRAQVGEVERQFLRVFDELREIRHGAGSGVAARPTRVESTDEGQLSETFYRELERHFRGTPDQIRSRLEIYRSYFLPLQGQTVVDLGCGGGEWLGLLRQWGIRPLGVDYNGLNTLALKQQGYAVVRDDAVGWLSCQPQATVAAITAFHLVEHLSAASLLAMLQQALRVLRPGGLLLLETPNPENLMVATQTFWLDPTHVRPLPAELLRFMMHFSGFKSCEVLRINPPEASDTRAALLGPPAMVGRDYAVIAYRPDSEGP